ncbi:hypothetical protein [Streptomyces coelicoflavus]
MKPTAQRRKDRRDVLDNLFSRTLRGLHLTPSEAALLVATVRDEQRAYDQTRRSLAETGTAYGKHRAAANDAIREAEDEAERFKADYLSACKTIADMHAAATGRTGEGPERGVVEDVADVRARMLAAEEALRNEQRERAEAAQLSHEYRNRAEAAERMVGILTAVDEGRAHGAQRIMGERDEAQQRAAQAEELLAAAHQCSNDAEAARADAEQRAAQAEEQAKLHARAAELADAVTAEVKRHLEHRTTTLRQRAQRAEQSRDRFETAWQNARQRAAEQGGLADSRQRRLHRRARRILELEQQTEQAERSAQAWEGTARQYATNMDEARHKADRYRLAWLACRRDRKADRAAMADELPVVNAGYKALADEDAKWWRCHTCDVLTDTDPCHICDTDRPAPDATPEVITDRATIRNTLDEPEPNRGECCDCPHEMEA